MKGSEIKMGPLDGYLWDDGKLSFVSPSSDGFNTYMTWVTVSREIVCTCSGFQYRATCRHANDVIAVLEAVE